VAKVWTGIKSQAAYLRRLSVVFAAELRLKIVTELYMREMSPKQFYEEFGGGSITRVDRHFKKLAKHGWLRFIRSESGGSRRGATEHFYRATELAIFDDQTWALVPYSLRVAISWRTFKQLAERVREALQAGTLDARADSRLSWKTLLLDQLGWERVVAAMGALFESLFEEQNDAKLRISHSKEKPILVTVALAAFESPAHPQDPGNRRATPRLVETCRDSPVPLPLRLSKVFADELCLQIIAEANLREISAPLFHSEFGGNIDGIRRRFKNLSKIGWLKKVNEKSGGRRRGATEKFYRATGPAIFDNESWVDVPDSIKTIDSWTTFKQLSDRVKEAIEAGTLEARLDNHMSWSLLRLDQLGCAKVTASVDALLALIFKERDRTEACIADSAVKPITTTVALAAFESPRDSTKAP
jgi:hypothetical protein